MRRTVTGQNAPIHHGGNHQASDVIHLVATIGCFAGPVIHLCQSKPPFFHETGFLGRLVFICPAVLPVLLPTPMMYRVEGSSPVTRNQAEDTAEAKTHR